MNRTNGTLSSTPHHIEGYENNHRIFTIHVKERLQDGPGNNSSNGINLHHQNVTTLYKDEHQGSANVGRKTQARIVHGTMARQASHMHHVVLTVDVRLEGENGRKVLREAFPSQNQFVGHRTADLYAVFLHAGRGAKHTADSMNYFSSATKRIRGHVPKLSLHWVSSVPAADADHSSRVSCS